VKVHALAKGAAVELMDYAAHSFVAAKARTAKIKHSL